MTKRPSPAPPKSSVRVVERSGGKIYISVTEGKSPSRTASMMSFSAGIGYAAKKKA